MITNIRERHMLGWIYSGYTKNVWTSGVLRQQKLVKRCCTLVLPLARNAPCGGGEGIGIERAASRAQETA